MKTVNRQHTGFFLMPLHQQNTAVLCKGLCTLSPTFSSEILARWKINTTSCCVNHVYTLPPKLSSVKKTFGSGSIFCVFASIACNLIGKDREYGKTYANISDSVCNDLKCVLIHWAAPFLSIHCSLFTIYLARVTCRRWQNPNFSPTVTSDYFNPINTSLKSPWELKYTHRHIETQHFIFKNARQSKTEWDLKECCKRTGLFL